MSRLILVAVLSDILLSSLIFRAHCFICLTGPQNTSSDQLLNLSLIPHKEMGSGEMTVPVQLSELC